MEQQKTTVELTYDLETLALLIQRDLHGKLHDGDQLAVMRFNLRESIRVLNASLVAVEKRLFDV